MKRCTSCKEEKDEVDFYNDKKSKDGKTHSCKRCMNVVSIRNQRAKRPQKKDWSTDPGFKICRKCLAKKPQGDFNLHGGNPRNKERLRNDCKECQSVLSKGIYAKNAVEERKKRKVHYKNNLALFHGYHLKRSFGISMDEYTKMMELQDGKCKICGSDQPNNGSSSKRFAVDHDHKTGEIRGLLCQFCNAGLGNFKDSPSLLQKAITYLTL